MCKYKEYATFPLQPVTDLLAMMIMNFKAVFHKYRSASLVDFFH